MNQYRLELEQSKMRARVAARSVSRGVVARVKERYEATTVRAEDRAANQYREYGWTVLSKGWPDLFMYRKQEDGKIALKLVEVKGPGDKLRVEQKVVLSLLHAIGINVCTYYEEHNKEVAGAGEVAEPPLMAQRVFEFAHPVELPTKSKYETTEDGGYKIPDKGAKPGYRVRYSCPECGSINTGRDRDICGWCTKKIYGLHKSEYLHSIMLGRMPRRLVSRAEMETYRQQLEAIQ